jgi:NAD(P)-dependent dehydrogenase (short-subunit alcohol dehydrogenase family)
MEIERNGSRPSVRGPAEYRARRKHGRLPTWPFSSANKTCGDPGAGHPAPMVLLPIIHDHARRRMTMSKVWFVTGAGRGFGIDIAEKALAAAHSVVATGRNPDAVLKAIGAHENLLTVALDITDPGRCDRRFPSRRRSFRPHRRPGEQRRRLLRGLLREHHAEHFRAQMETSFFGPLNVTRTVLPIMRAQRSGQVITVSSLDGLIGQEFVVAYAASKFALEGWLESLRFDTAPFGIETRCMRAGPANRLPWRLLDLVITH